MTDFASGPEPAGTLTLCKSQVSTLTWNRDDLHDRALDAAAGRIPRAARDPPDHAPRGYQDRPQIEASPAFLQRPVGGVARSRPHRVSASCGAWRPPQAATRFAKRRVAPRR